MMTILVIDAVVLLLMFAALYFAVHQYARWRRLSEMPPIQVVPVLKSIKLPDAPEGHLPSAVVDDLERFALDSIPTAPPGEPCANAEHVNVMEEEDIYVIPADADELREDMTSWQLKKLWVRVQLCRLGLHRLKDMRPHLLTGPECLIPGCRRFYGNSDDHILGWGVEEPSGTWPIYEVTDNKVCYSYLCEPCSESEAGGMGLGEYIGEQGWPSSDAGYAVIPTRCLT